MSRRVILALDNYEVFRLMDTWLRQVFVPSLGDNTRLLLVGREPPSPLWLIAREWQGLFQSLTLEPLGNTASLNILRRAGLGEKDAVRINRFARGHPLALKLAASAALERPGLNLREETVHKVVQELTRICLADINDSVVRRALEASSVVRRITRSTLAAMLCDMPADLFDRLRAISLLENRPDGLMLHDAVRNSIATSLRAADPRAYREYRRAAWRQLRGEFRSAAGPDLWRYTADLIYLIENPVVREAFFPSESPQFAVEPAVADDGKQIRQIITKHEGTQAAKTIAFWWDNQPAAFRVARDGSERVAGFYCMFDPYTANETLLVQDPVVSIWWNHLRDHRVESNERVLFLRRWLSRAEGELPSPAQAACWLDIKRTYMDLRPNLRRVYITVRDLPTYAPVAVKLGFRPLSDRNVILDGNVYHTAMLDFGPASVDGWISGLVAAELGVEENDILDVEARELTIDGVRVDLTKLEFEVMHYLSRNEGKAITRDQLLDDVWGQSYHGGSNVVDVIIRSLRNKIGARSGMIETVRGVGYRFRRS
jgi:hypothetical protein